MAVEVKNFIEEMLGKLPPNHPDRKFLEDQLRVFTGRQAEVTGQEEKPINLELEWQRQAGRYVELGFHEELGLSVEDYLASLPRFEPQPETFVGRFDIPVLVETRIAPSRQAELSGLVYYLRGLKVYDWDGDPKSYKTLGDPYTAWMHDGKRNLKRSVRDVRTALETDERGATIQDGMALYIARPNVLDDHYIDLPGTSVGSGNAPYLLRWRDRSEVDYVRTGLASPKFGSASCGRVAI